LFCHAFSLTINELPCLAFRAHNQFMGIKELAETTIAILASVGGGGAIVFALSGYLGKRWADTALERQKQEYSQLNIAFQHQLDVISRRLQVELDALGLVNRLRTQEEFTRLAGLWKRIANIRNYYGTLAQMGLKLTPEDEEERKRYDAQVRHQFETWLNDGQMFLSEEMLFIPKHISDVAEKALRAAVEERFSYAAFGRYLDAPLIPGGTDAVFSVRKQYYDAIGDSFKRFSELTVELERLMREHLAGSGMQLNIPPTQKPDSGSDKA
jgi:hypothetical protein